MRRIKRRKHLMISDNIVSAAEAVLFAGGDPVDGRQLASVLDVSVKELPEIAGRLNERYKDCGSSLMVMKLGDSWQLTAGSEYADYIKAAAETRRNTPLSPAAMEVLTIVAYNQPVSKSFVERIRGVDSSSVVNSLVEKGLLEEAGRLTDVPGHPASFRTTPVFLRCFGLESLDGLPPIPNLKKNDAEDPSGIPDGEADAEEDSTAVKSG